MLLLLAEVLRSCDVAERAPRLRLLGLPLPPPDPRAVGRRSLHDLIQPSFSFLVGAALPFSVASRGAAGQSAAPTDPATPSGARPCWSFSASCCARSAGRRRTSPSRTRSRRSASATCSSFLLALRPVRDQWIALALILVGYWAAFAAVSRCRRRTSTTPRSACRRTGRTTTAGFAAHWNKNSNLAWAFDVWFLNLFPREQPFVFNRGGYATLSFIPTLGTMILGLIAGQRPARASARRPRACAGWWSRAWSCSPRGWLLGALGIYPVVKRIWTPSFTLLSGGVVLADPGRGLLRRSTCWATAAGPSRWS